MFKNVASQKLIVFAFDSTTNSPKTGDAANITAYVSKDYGAATVLTDTSASEIDATNAKGYYLFDLAQAETNANVLLFSAKSSTSNIVVIGVPATVFTVPANFTATSIDSSGNVAANVTQLLGTAWFTPATAGTPDVNVKLWNGLTTVALPLVPTTAGRTLDVSATGEAGIDWNNIGTASASQNLSNTTVFTATVAGTVSGNVNGNVGGNVTGSVGSVAAGGITASSIADSAIDRATFAADTGLQTTRSNTAQAGGATSITLDASASATTDYYINQLIYITGGTGVGQAKFCTAYNGTTKVATVNSAWATNPDNTSTFAIIPFDAIPGATAPTAAAVADAVWDESRSGHVASGSFGEYVIANSTLIGGQTASASGTITFPNATLASTTNITAGTITTSTNVTTVNGLAAGVITATSIASDAITAAKIADGAIDRATFAADTGLQTIRSGTAQAGATTTITLDASASATNDIYNDCWVYITGGTGAGQVSNITDYVGATKVADVHPHWITAPDNTSTFAILPSASDWHHIVADHAIADSFGYLFALNLDGTVSSRASQTSVNTLATYVDTEVAAILADTNELQTDWVNGGRLDLLIDAIKAKTDNLPADPADASDIAASFSTISSTLTTISAYIDTEVAAIKAKTDNLPAAPAATGDIPTVSQIWTTALTEAYRGTGATGTATQLLYEILQNLTEFAISGTTKTAKKLDGSTTAKTYTLDSSTTPTSITETT